MQLGRSFKLTGKWVCHHGPNRRFEPRNSPSGHKRTIKKVRLVMPWQVPQGAPVSPLVACHTESPKPVPCGANNDRRPPYGPFLNSYPTRWH